MAPKLLTLTWAFLSATTVLASPFRSLNKREPTSVAGYTYKGCYTEATNMRALTGNAYFDDKMTLEKCALACDAFPVFGVEYGRECYCGASLNAGSDSTSEADCSFPCPGNADQTCGAGNRLNIYTKEITSTPPTSVVSYSPVGCYSETSGGRTLAGYNFGSDTMTVEVCATACKGYKYFGLEYYRECYCGNYLAIGSNSLESGACTFPCVGDNTQICGGDWKLNVFSFGSTSQPSSSTSASSSPTPSTSNSLYKPDGCYTEATTGRALSDASFYDDKMTIEKCEAVCTGHKYFGVEYGRECFCGETFNPGSQPTSNDECNFPCPGNSAQLCGAGLRLNVYVLKSSLTVSSSSSSSSSSSTSSSSSESTTSLTSSSSSSSSQSSTTTTPTLTSSSSSQSSTTTTTFTSSSFASTSTTSSTTTESSTTTSFTTTPSPTTTTTTTTSTTAPACTYTSPISNGGFETITGTSGQAQAPGWAASEFSGSTYLYSIASSFSGVAPHSGARYYSVKPSNNVQSTNQIRFRQTITVCVGKTYRATAWFKNMRTNSGITVGMSTQIFTQSQPQISMVTNTNYDAGLGWVMITGTFVPTTEQTKFYISMWAPPTYNGATNLEILWDDVSIALES